MHAYTLCTASAPPLSSPLLQASYFRLNPSTNPFRPIPFAEDRHTAASLVNVGSGHNRLLSSFTSIGTWVARSWMIGTRYERVLPEPVGARTIASLRATMAGTAPWMHVAHVFFVLCGDEFVLYSMSTNSKCSCCQVLTSSYFCCRWRYVNRYTCRLTNFAYHYGRHRTLSVCYMYLCCMVCGTNSKCSCLCHYSILQGSWYVNRCVQTVPALCAL